MSSSFVLKSLHIASLPFLTRTKCHWYLGSRERSIARVSKEMESKECMNWSAIDSGWQKHHSLFIKWPRLGQTTLGATSTYNVGLTHNNSNSHINVLSDSSFSQTFETFCSRHQWAIMLTQAAPCWLKLMRAYKLMNQKQERVSHRHEMLKQTIILAVISLLTHIGCFLCIYAAF